jgi:hypothetical protein
VAIDPRSDKILKMGGVCKDHYGLQIFFFTWMTPSYSEHSITRKYELCIWLMIDRELFYFQLCNTFFYINCAVKNLTEEESHITSNTYMPIHHIFEICYIIQPP